MKFNYKWLLLLSLGFVACSSDDDMSSGKTEDIEVVSGEADFSTYVSIGNSLTAGYTDGALFVAGQQKSMPNMLAGRFAMAGGGTFSQPLMNDNIGGLLLGGNELPGFGPRLYFDGSGPAILPAMPTTDLISNPAGPFNNMGVPGAKSYHLLAEGYGNIAGLQTDPPSANPYFVRMASGANTTVMADALAQNPTFFTLWIGNNDVLSYALSGGSGEDQNGNLDPATYGSNDITDPNVFAQVYSGLLATLTSGGAKGIVANIPDIISIPHFTTVPYNPVPLDAGTVEQLNAGYVQYNGGLALAQAGGLIDEDEQARRTVNFVVGQNPVVIVDEDLTDLSLLGIPSYRMATAEDLLVLPSASFIGTLVNNDPSKVNGVSVPLEDKWVLIPGEQSAIQMATAAFNQTIDAVATQYNMPVVDANSLLGELKTGIEFDEFGLNSNLVFGGAISLDGVHPTARGYAYIANQFLKKIDEAYGSNFEEADVLLKARDYNVLYPAQLP